MPSIINASTSAGLITTADTSGVLHLQSAGATITAVSTTGVLVTGTLNSSGNLTTDGSLGVGVAPDGTQHVHIGAGTTTKAPLEYTPGVLMTTSDQGSVEYDGTMKYFTNDTVSGRGYNPTVQIFNLFASGSAVTGTGNFFGSNSAANLAGGGEYEVEAYCYFTKTTAGTVTVTAATSLAPLNLNGTLDHGAITGGTATGASNRISLFNSTSTAAAFAASGSLTTAVNHCFVIRLIIEANASASNLRINFTSSAGSITPLRGSYYKVTRLPSANTGSFAA